MYVQERQPSCTSCMSVLVLETHWRLGREAGQISDARQSHCSKLLFPHCGPTVLNCFSWHINTSSLFCWLLLCIKIFCASMWDVGQAQLACQFDAADDRCFIDFQQSRRSLQFMVSPQCGPVAVRAVTSIKLYCREACEPHAKTSQGECMLVLQGPHQPLQ